MGMEQHVTEHVLTEYYLINTEKGIVNLVN